MTLDEVEQKFRELLVECDDNIDDLKEGCPEMAATDVKYCIMEIDVAKACYRAALEKVASTRKEAAAKR